VLAELFDLVAKSLIGLTKGLARPRFCKEKVAADRYIRSKFSGKGPHESTEIGLCVRLAVHLVGVLEH